MKVTQALDDRTCADGVHSIVAPDPLPDGKFRCLNCNRYFEVEGGEVVDEYDDKRPADVRARGKGKRVWPQSF